MARNDETRNIAINFQTNVSSTVDQLRDLQSTLDESSSEYSELTLQIEKTEQALKDYDTLLESNIATEKQLAQSKERLQKQFTNNEKVIQKNTTATKSLTKEITSNGGAIAILDSLTGGMASKFRDASEASTVFQGSLKGVRGALIATGVGAFIVLLGLLIANWDKVTDALDNTNKAQKAVNDAMKAGASNVKAEANELQNLLKIARDETASKEARLNAIKAINTLSPEYLGNITLETVNTKEVNAQIERYIELLIKKAQVQALEESIIQVYKDQATALQDIADSEEGFVGQRLKGAQNLFNGLYDTEEVYNNKRVKAKADADKKVEALNNQLTTILSESPDLIFKETVKANEGKVNSTVKTNKKIVDSEKDKINFLKKIETDYNDWLKTNGSNVSDNSLAETEVKIRKLNELREQDLKDAQKYVTNNKEKYDELTGTINSYYDNQVNKLTEQSNVIKSIQNTANTLQSTVVDTADLDSVSKHYQDILSFVEGIEDSDIKKYYSELFNVENINKAVESIETYKENVDELLDFNVPEGTTVLNKLFGSESDAKVEIDRVKSFNEKLLNEQEQQALKEAELLGRTEAEKTQIKEYYSKLRKKNEQETAEAIAEINRLAQEQQLASLDTYAGALETTASLLGEHTAGHKMLAIAQTTIDTYTSAMSAYSGMVAAIPGPVGIAAGVAAAAASVVTGISNVKKILAVKVPGGGGASATLPSATATPNVNFVSSSENQIATSVSNATNNQNNEPIKAYVVSSDVSTAQQLENNKIESNSI